MTHKGGDMAMEQHEITTAQPLLDEQGNLREAGYAKRMLPIYDRNMIKGGALRIKEWDYYLVMNGQFALALTIADNSYMGLDSISLLDFWENTQVTKSPMHLLPMGNTGMPSSSMEGDSASGGRGYSLLFRREEDKRSLYAHMEHFDGRAPLDAYIEFTDEPEESMVICTPFDKPGHFYFNQKINCLRASGKVTVGEKEYMLDPSDTFAVLDWGRGVWTYHNTWYWASASGLVEGVPFGFNLGYGFGDTSAATENMLFYNGKAHKLSKVRFKIPGRRRRRRSSRSPAAPGPRPRAAAPAPGPACRSAGPARCAARTRSRRRGSRPRCAGRPPAAPAPGSCSRSEQFPSYASCQTDIELINISIPLSGKKSIYIGIFFCYNHNPGGDPG